MRTALTVKQVKRTVYLFLLSTLNLERPEIVQTDKDKWRFSWRDSFVGQIGHPLRIWRLLSPFAIKATAQTLRTAILPLIIQYFSRIKLSTCSLPECPTFVWICLTSKLTTWAFFRMKIGFQASASILACLKRPPARSRPFP